MKACVTPGKRGAGVEKKSGVKHAQVWVVQGWVTTWDEGQWGEKKSRVKGAQTWAVQERMTCGVGGTCTW